MAIMKAQPMAITKEQSVNKHADKIAIITTQARQSQTYSFSETPAVSNANDCCLC